MKLVIGKSGTHEAPLSADDLAHLPGIAETRETTTITRRALCIACRDVGLFTNEDAIAAARGEWPALLMTALDGLTDNQKADAQMEWSDVSTVRRTAPLIALLQWHLNYTDAQVDALFGIATLPDP
jgi:hypothetical protein